MKKYGFALLSGFLIALSFPTVLFKLHFPNLGFLAWVGLVPLLVVLSEASPSEAFRLGFVFSAFCNLVTYYWLYIALNTFGHIQPFFSFFILLLLAVFMALYIGAVTGFARFLSLKGLEFLVLLPILWVLAEWARNYTPFGGFPWTNLAVSQYRYLPLIQFADITGAYGIVFLIVWFNIWLTEAILKWQGKKIPLFFAKTTVTMIFLAVVLGYGLYRLPHSKTEMTKAPHLKVGLIQPNIPQDEKWDEAKRLKQKFVFDEAVKSLEQNVDLIVWPESSWTDSLWIDEKGIPPREIGLTTARGNRPFTLLGLDIIALRENRQRYFNSAALLDAQGKILGKYHKGHLVPFGEYVPLRKLFFFLKPVAAIGDFEAGEEIAPLSLENFKIGPLICFEDIFPEISRTMVRKGANLLINITNDAWYGVSSAPYHHLALSALRSVETRRSMVRATNTGVSAIVEPTGNVTVASPIFENGVLLHQVPLLTDQTLYTRLGDWFVLACFIFIVWQGVRLYVQRN